MAKCSFCGEQIERGTGKMLVYISGKIDYFCSTKCEKNLLKLGRRPVDARWTAASRAERKKGKGA
ncbi:MAG: 50S ribosomal protein L24e [Nanoarchaeota archaeon]